LQSTLNIRRCGTRISVNKVFLCNFLHILNISRKARKEEYNICHGGIPHEYLLWKLPEKTEWSKKMLLYLLTAKINK